MDLVLIGFAIAVLGVVGALVVFSVAMRGREEEETRPLPDFGPFPAAETFFFPSPQPAAKVFPNLTPEEVLSRLERHFLSEESAVISFLDGPSVESLHSPSASPFWSEGTGS